MDQAIYQKKHRMIWNLPNILTYGRILAIPLFVTCFYFSGELPRFIALGLFITASVTDFLDGYLARAWSQQSKLGQMLDPIADKLLVGAALIMLVFDDTIFGLSVIAAVIILSREILVSGLREFLAQLSVSVPVTRIAKFKTAAQLGAIVALLLAPLIDKNATYTWVIGDSLLWIAAILTIYTGFDYLRVGIKHLIEEDLKDE
ncbi:MAG: CDP-diacylglycerol--glycerol-3-phosphate 3-phosphatidyltransferase [Rhodomicrobium sp.]|nr:MAG: CDP-diacylglycerol--glycerol-3-phosphate 3-phosphatidyltransferase [Rhodomicrobium sp.]